MTRSRGEAEVDVENYIDTSLIKVDVQLTHISHSPWAYCGLFASRGEAEVEVLGST